MSEKYYSASTKGFYDSAIHGAKSVSVIDPSWVRPVITVTLNTGESVRISATEEVTNTSNVPIVLTDIPDMSAIPDTIEVDNPDCVMPVDAVKVSDQDYNRLLDGQLQGKSIVPDANGYPVSVELTYTFEETKEKKFYSLAYYRYKKETQGITLNGVVIKTDRESQAMINGAKSFSDLNPTALIDWKGENGWIQIDRDTILAIGLAVGTHVQACFSNEKLHAEAIALLTTKEAIEAYDFTTGWPA